MSFPLQRAARGVLPAAALVAAAVLGISAGVRWRADYLARSPDPGDWARAAALEPGNAAHQNRLGRLYQFDFERGDLEQAIVHYQRAVELNPHSPDYWTDLAGAWEMQGDAARALEAMNRARAAHPESARVAWSRGNLLLRQGQVPAAFAEMRRAVQRDSSLAYVAVLVAWRASGDADAVLAPGGPLPAGEHSYRTALRFFLTQRQPQAARAAWSALLGAAPRQELAAAFPLIELLLRHEHWAEARAVWHEALRASGTAPPDEGGSLVRDGGFERPLDGGGFGWRLHSGEGLRVDFDTAAPQQGRRALRVTFDGTANLAFSHVRQTVQVTPGARYRFRGYLRSEAISTDNGVSFLLRDPRDPRRLQLVTPEMRGTQPWTLHELEFTAGPETHLVEIMLRRAPSRRVDNKLRGVVWADGVSLERLAPAGAGR